MRTFLRVPAAVAGLALCLAASNGPAPANAQTPIPSPAPSSSFRAIGQYSLEVDGKPAPGATFFHSQGLGAILIRTPEVPGFLELQPRTNSVDRYSEDAFHRNSNGTLDRLPRAKPLGTSPFQLVGSLPQFEVAGHRLAVKEKAPLLGPQTAKGLVAYDPTYETRAKLYTPQTEYLDVLQNVQEKVTIRVFFGSWCSVCAELIPHVLRVEEALADSNFRFEYYGVPRDYDDAEAKRLKVTNVPTGIVYIGDQEVHRISGYSWRFPEMSLRNMVLRNARPAGP